MLKTKILRCCRCGIDAHTAYEINSHIFCEDCLWELLKDKDVNFYDETVTTYIIGELQIKDNREKAIKEACDYLDIECKKIY